MSKEKAANNRNVGQIYYNAVVDSEGYPNGLAGWTDLTPQDQYFYSALGVMFLERLQAQKYVSFDSSKLGLGPSASWDSGDCKELFDLLKEKS